MGKKVIISFLFLSIAVVLLAYFYTYSNDKVHDPNSRDLGLGKALLFNKIQIVQDNDTLVLNKSSSGWMVNNKYVLRVDKLVALESVVRGLQVLRRVEKEKVQKVKTDITEEGKEVTVFSNGNVEMQYKLGSDLNDTSGVYVLKRGAEMPYVAYVLGEKNIFNDLISVNENDWRSLVLFRLGSNKINEVRINHSLDTANSLSLITTGHELTIVNYKGESSTELNLQNAIEFMRSFKSIKAKGVSEEGELGVQFFDMELVLETGKKWSASGFRKSADKGQLDFSGKQLIYDNELFYLKYEEEVYLMDYFSFDNLLKKYSDIIK